MKKRRTVILTLLLSITLCSCGNHSQTETSNYDIIHKIKDFIHGTYTEKPEEAFEEIVYDLENLEKSDFNLYNGHKCSINTITNLIDYYAVYSMNASDIYDIYFFYYDSDIDESKKDILSTQRNIYLGDPKDKVIKYYGKGEDGTVDSQDFLFGLLQDDDSVRALELAEQQCKSFIRYEEETLGRISFYFDDNDEVSWVIYEIYHS